MENFQFSLHEILEWIDLSGYNNHGKIYFQFSLHEIHIVRDDVLTRTGDTLSILSS